MGTAARLKPKEEPVRSGTIQRDFTCAASFPAPQVVMATTSAAQENCECVFPSPPSFRPSFLAHPYSNIFRSCCPESAI
jgi:hypothetical protein